MERIFYSALTVSASGAAAVGAATPHPYAWLASIAVGCLAAMIVRGVSILDPAQKKKRVWSFEALVTMLSVLLTAVIVHDRAMSIAAATFAGVGIGGLGVGVISIARTAAGNFIRNMAKSVLGTVDDKPS